jgi:Transposase and inactivated derivatives
MRRALKLSLKFLTQRKQRQIAALLEAYRAAVNFYIQSLWKDRGRLDKATLARLKRTQLSERYKSQALKQAIESVVATKKSAQALGVPASCPIFTGSAVLDAKFVTVEQGQRCFDLAIKLSTLNKGQRITLLTQKTAPFLRWISFPNASVIQGCALSEEGIIVWVEIPDAELKASGEVLGIDIGVNKIISDSNGEHYGREFKAIRDKIKRRKPGSQRRRCAHEERRHTLDAAVNSLPFDRIAVLGVEALHDMKRGKKKGRSKRFRKAMAPWTYRHALNRIEQRAQENRVLLVRVDPTNTSRTCPDCGAVHKDNRKGETFLCLACGRAGDADTVGAENVLARTLATLGSVASPRL